MPGSRSSTCCKPSPVEIGADTTVFSSAERLASWVGICPGNNESAGKRKSGRIRKGNAWMRRLRR